MKKPAFQRYKTSSRGTSSNSFTASGSGKLVQKAKTRVEPSAKIISPLKVIHRDLSGTYIENIIHLSSDIIVRLGKDHTVKFINQAGCQALGYTHKQIVGKNWFDDFVTPSMRASAFSSNFREQAKFSLTNFP